MQAESPFQDLLASLSARTPAPGAGCAAAWTGAIAAGLLEMVSAFADDAEAEARAPVLRAELLAAAEHELRSYAPVLEALRLPAGSEERERELAAALSAASEVPVAIARAATEVAELAARVTAASKPSLKGDATAGVLLAEAAARSAARLVEINLNARPHDPRLEEVARLRRRAAKARERALGDDQPEA
jgi:formiminotetrahydrofolate cyclodeaminase